MTGVVVYARLASYDSPTAASPWRRQSAGADPVQERCPVHDLPLITTIAAAFAAAWEDGRTLTVDEAVVLALGTLQTDA